ncbi:MAG: hypothetical protein M3P32_09885 [Chloroflexota bacterium]|nr:hypothetical protein [Chloroflexota bacterium]
MIDPIARLRTEDTIVYELLQGSQGSDQPTVVGTALFRDGESAIDAPEAIAVAVRELLSRPFVDRVRADERPRGYRRSQQGQVDLLVPGMPEHFVARMRGLWLPYPDGTLVTARPAVGRPSVPGPRAALPDVTEGEAPVTDPSVRRASLADSTELLSARPLVRPNEPASGLRPSERRTVARTDCGWLT